MQAFPFSTSITALAIGLGAATGALAQTTAPGQPQGTSAVEGPTVAVSTASITGKVTAIDRSERTVAVRGDDGRAAKLTVGANVPNFHTIDIGDEVTMRYTEAVSLALAKGGLGTDAQLGEIRTKVEADAARRAKDGMPGMAAMERTTLVANVFQIDRQRGVLTLRGTDGVPVEIKVPDKQALDQIALDDQVVIGYRQAAAVSIEPGDASGAAGDPRAAAPGR